LNPLIVMPAALNDVEPKSLVPVQRSTLVIFEARFPVVETANEYEVSRVSLHT